MGERRRWRVARGLAAAGLVATVAVALGTWWLSDGNRRTRLWERAIGGAHTDPSVLRGAGRARDGGVAEPSALGETYDGGWPGGRWLPTATVTDDPSSPHGSLTGRVVSRSDGAPIDGAELVFVHDGASSGVRTGADGTFHLRASASGRYVLSVASAEGFIPFAPEWGHSAVAFDAVAERRVDGAVVHLAPLSERIVEVVDAEDAPVVGARVTLLGAESGERSMAPVEGQFTTDGDGRAQVGGWAGALIEATHPDHGSGRGRIGWRPSDAPVRITLGSRDEAEAGDASIAGVVVSPRGSPIVGVVVQAMRRARGLHPSGQGVTGRDGRFVIEGLDRGEHTLVADHPSRPRTRLTRVMTGRTDARVEMAGGARVTGRVVDEHGEAVPAFTVMARISRGGLTRRTVDSTSSYDAEGRFELSGLSAGSYELIATSRGFPPSPPVPVTVRLGAETSASITLRRGGRIEGVVSRASDGAPIEGATLSLEGRLGSGNSAVPLLARALSDADGHYVLEGIGETHSSVRVHADGHHSRIVSGLRLTPGDTQRVDLQLTPLEEGEEARTELAGIGAIMMPRGQALMIGRVVDGGGAQRAGLARGDLVLAVDGQPVTALGFGGAIDRIRGDVGTAVQLRVQKRGEDAPREITITRQRVRT